MEKIVRTLFIATVLRTRKPATSSILEILGMTTSEYSAVMLARDHARVHARRNRRLLVVLPGVRLLLVEYGTKKKREKTQEAITNSCNQLEKKTSKAQIVGGVAFSLYCRLNQLLIIMQLLLYYYYKS
jgi:hypothetical protein